MLTEQQARERAITAAKKIYGSSSTYDGKTMRIIEQLIRDIRTEEREAVLGEAIKLADEMAAGLIAPTGRPGEMDRLQGQITAGKLFKRELELIRARQAQP